MQDNFTKIGFERIFEVDKIITLFYAELPKNFYYSGDSHECWEMIYVDKGEMIFTADNQRVVLKSGELAFHKPGQIRNLSGNNSIAPNVSVISFETKSREMEYFEGKIFRLNSEEKMLLSALLSEGRPCFEPLDAKNPLLKKMKIIDSALIGGLQMTQNLLEVFLIKLRRNKEMFTKKNRRSYRVNGIDIPYDVKSILACLESKIYGNCSISEVAKSLGKSESAIKNVFSLYKAGGIMRHYNHLKIEEAKRLIREGKYNMTQIADLLCFDNPQYFSKCFRMYTNMSPSEYKASIVE